MATLFSVVGHISSGNFRLKCSHFPFFQGFGVMPVHLAFNLPKNKIHKVISRATVGTKQCFLASRRDVQETNFVEFLENSFEENFG